MDVERAAKEKVAEKESLAAECAALQDKVKVHVHVPVHTQRQQDGPLHTHVHLEEIIDMYHLRT